MSEHYEPMSLIDEIVVRRLMQYGLIGRMHATKKNTMYWARDGCQHSLVTAPVDEVRVQISFSTSPMYNGQVPRIMRIVVEKPDDLEKCLDYFQRYSGAEFCDMCHQFRVSHKQQKWTAFETDCEHPLFFPVACTTDDWELIDLCANTGTDESDKHETANSDPVDTDWEMV